MPSLEERLERLCEQKIRPYELDCDAGQYYAIFECDHVLDAFQEFEKVVCENGCCVIVNLGRMH